MIKIRTKDTSKLQSEFTKITQKSTVTEWYELKELDDVFWIVICLSDEKSGLNRKFFSKDHAGGGLFNRLNIERLEEIYSKDVDNWLENCGKLNLTACDSNSERFLAERISKEKFIETA